MKIFIDGDAFPNLLKQIVFKAICRLKIELVVVSNKVINVGKSSLIEYIIVDAGPDEADDYIADMVEENDIVITGDIPLADRVVSKNAYAIDHRGKMFTENNIKQALAVRDLMQVLRDSGEITGGPKAMTKKDAHQFANHFDSFLYKILNG